MNFNLVTNLETCSTLIREFVPTSLILYSHIPTVVIALLIGVFVFIKNRKELTGKILLAIAIVFSLWSLFDLITWFSKDSRVTMFSWSLLGILDILIFILSLYFAYAFVDRKDMSFAKKTILGFLFFPILFFTPTIFNVSGFNVDNCEAIEGGLFTNYYYFLGLGIFVWLLIVVILRYRSAEKEFKKQILLFSIGIELFLFSFFITGYYSSLLGNFQLLFYGLFGMAIFMGFLAYIIVRFKAFDIKLIGAQALVVALILLVGSQFFFAQNTTALVLTGVTLLLTGIIGIFLMRSVKKEVERKEELQLMADKLATANDQLRKLDNAKTEFISIASHQLRTPITAIKGFSSLLLEGSYGEISESVKGALEKVYSSSERLVALIEDLLNVSRIESGRMQFDFAPSSVEKLIKELYDNFILIAKTKKFYLDLKLPEIALPEVIMDYTKIRELTSNFIDNALKYTEKGGVTVKAELRESGVLVDDNGFVIEGQKSEFGQVVRITVSDTGIGIPREEIPYLFKKFSRGKDVSRLHVGGTGLGLYVGKAIAEAHHGQVWVESDGTGLGSRF
ncbi:MAG: PAS/PAC sensor signal transduction histidine kinase, partial [uncultured bacterium]